MEIFISYCDDTDGLKFARKAKSLFATRDIDAWVWEDDASYTEYLSTEISQEIVNRQALLALVTKGTKNSNAQKDEWSTAKSAGNLVVSMIKNGIERPSELIGRRCADFNENNFEVKCEEVARDLLDESKIQVTKSKLREETDIILYKRAIHINKRQESLNPDIIEEFNKEVWDGYLSNTIIRDNTLIKGIETYDDTSGYIAVIMNSFRDLSEINAKNYYWEPYFNQMGRAIAISERTLLQESIDKQTDDCNRKIELGKENIEIVQEEIDRLLKSGYAPTSILVPAKLLSLFYKFFGTQIKENRGRSVVTVDDKIMLNLLWVGSETGLNKVMIIQKSAVEWSIIHNPDTGFALTLAIGLYLYPDKVALLAGTIVKCDIKNSDAISVIPIVG